MTDQEKRQSRGELLVNLEEAQKNLAHLQEKAEQFSDAMEGAATKLRRNANRKPSAEECAAGVDSEDRLGPECQSLPSYAEALRLIDELNVARRKVWNLESRKARTSGVPIPRWE